MPTEEALRRGLERIAKEDFPSAAPAETRSRSAADRYVEACWYAEHVLAGGDPEAGHGYTPAIIPTKPRT